MTRANRSAIHRPGLRSVACQSLVAGLLALAAGSALADGTVTLTQRQSGGIFADGGLNNGLGFQNYYVGYGTTPGFGRTAERRSFFVFDLPPLPAGWVLSGARLELQLPYGGLIFGKGPGEPGVDEVAPDPYESFQLGLLPVASAVVTDVTLPPAAGMLLFSMMDDLPVAMPRVFHFGDLLHDIPDGDVPVPPVTIAIELDAAGLSALAAAMGPAGGEIVFSGWMPSWSHDERLNPTPPPLYFEASELIFGHTNVHVDPALASRLVLLAAPIPELPAAWLWAAGLLALSAWRRSVGAAAATGRS